MGNVRSTSVQPRVIRRRHEIRGCDRRQSDSFAGDLNPGPYDIAMSIPSYPDEDPHDLRHPVARELRKQLERLLENLRPPRKRRGPPKSPRPAPIGPGLLIPVVLALGLGIGLVEWYDNSGRAERPRDGGRPPPAVSPPIQESSVSATPAPRDTTAICRDGTPSFSKHASGTCSGHGGVLCWLHHPGLSAPTSSPYCTSISRTRE